MMFPVAILCGGLATRLRPATDNTPKSLLEIAGRPFIHHQLELLKSQGLERVLLCVGHFGERIRAAVGDGRAFGLAASYSFDGAAPLGTGGALRHALPLLGDHFFVLYGDSYLRCSYRRVQSAYESCGRPALMTVSRNPDRRDKNNVVFRDGEVIEYDKSNGHAAMAHIDFGLSVLSPAALSSHAAAEFEDLADIYKNLAADGRLAGLEMAERFYEIGSVQGIRDTEAYLRNASAAV